jgi:ubiquinone/menaquinone biosynthesis C-methylase UbiE
VPNRDGDTFRATLFARYLHPRLNAAAMAHGQGEHRARTLAGLAGRVVEVGAGDGANFAYYPEAVTEVVAIEPEEHMRARARDAARTARVPIEVHAGMADRLPVEDASFDAAVLSLVLCSVPDQAAALGEVRRVLRDGGELRFYEQVHADRPPLRMLQSAVTPIWSRLGGGCHLNRHTEHAITDAGFTIERIERFAFRPGLLATVGAPHILGSARLTA